MTRKIIAVIVGYAVWTVLWLGGNALFFSDLAASAERGEAIVSVGSLSKVLLLSFACSLVAGLITSTIGNSARAVLVTGALLLLTGIGVQASVWTLMPVWYHVLFLAAIVPLVVVGSRLRGASRAAAPAKPV
jgi:hypothetical protein